MIYSKSISRFGRNCVDFLVMLRRLKELKSENIKWGLRKSTMDPDSPAFSRRCYGYDRNDEEGLILNIAEARIVLKIFDWYEQGWSIVRIKKELETL